MNFSKLPGKQWVYPAFAAVIVGLLSLMWKLFPILLIVAGFLMFVYWMQKYGKKKAVAPPAKPTTPAPPVK